MFQRVRAQDHFVEAGALLERHYQEAAHWKDQPYEPEWEVYKVAEDAGLVRAFTMRVDGNLVGYALFFVRPNIHAMSVDTAVQDIFFVDHPFRGLAGPFLKWIERQLIEDQVDVVTHGVPYRHPTFGKILERLGYEPVSVIYSKRVEVAIHG